jgi:hypothetical protein
VVFRSPQLQRLIELDQILGSFAKSFAPDTFALPLEKSFSFLSAALLVDPTAYNKEPLSFRFLGSEIY